MGGGESGLIGTMLTRLLDSSGSGLLLMLLRSCRDGFRRGGGGRLVDGTSGEFVIGLELGALYVVGDVGGVRLACAVDGRAEMGGGLLRLRASIDVLRAGTPPPPPVVRTLSARDIFRGEVAGRALAYQPEATDFAERTEAPRDTLPPALALPAPAPSTPPTPTMTPLPNASVPVDACDRTEFDRDRCWRGSALAAAASCVRFWPAPCL